MLVAVGMHSAKAHSAWLEQLGRRKTANFVCELTAMHRNTGRRTTCAAAGIGDDAEVIQHFLLGRDDTLVH
jgi:hypothetical protein